METSDKPDYDENTIILDNPNQSLEPIISYTESLRRKKGGSKKLNLKLNQYKKKYTKKYNKKLF